MVVSTLIGGVNSAWAAGPVTGWTARSTGAQSVALIEGEKPGTWIDLNGGGILEQRPTTDAKRTTHGGRLLWKESRFAQDLEGGTHVFHQQRYMPSARTTVSGLRVPRDGFRLRGSSIGFHSDETGHLYGIAGTRFQDIKVVIKPAVVTRVAALGSAIEGARAQRADIAFLESLDEEMVKRLLGKAKLELASIGDGRTFGFLWTLKVATTRGSLLNVVLDAATGEVLSIFDGHADSTCEPSSSTEVSVNGKSQLGHTIYGLPATEADNLDYPWSDFTREAHRVRTSSSVPEIIVYLGEDRVPGDLCAESGDQFFRVFPLKSAGGPIWYDDRTVYGRLVPGKSAADAMNHTIQTLDVFRQHGWDSYDGQGGPAKIAVDSFCSGVMNQAKFDTSGDAVDFPADGVGICRLSPDSHYAHQPSASLEVVAHEWAHGVMIHSNGSPYDGSQSLHEGFADVVGYAVEILNGGSGAWKYGEDLFPIDEPDMDRRVDEDSQTGHLNRHNSFHRCDLESMRTPWLDPISHVSGNKLPVAFRMMAVGGANPGVSGCNVSNYCAYETGIPPDLCDQSQDAVLEGGLGTDHAFDFLFELFVWYAPASVDWVDLPNLATIVGRAIGPPAKLIDKGVIIVPGVGGAPECVRYNDYEGAQSAHTALTAIGYKPNHQLIGPCE